MDDKKTNHSGEDYDTEALVKRLNIISVYLVSQWSPSQARGKYRQWIIM